MQSGQNVQIGEVTKLSVENAKWRVHFNSVRSGRALVSKGFDGVVVTGPGPALEGFSRPSDPRITDGVSFWINPTEYLEAAGNAEGSIIIVGSGGTAAAIAAWLVRNDPNRRPIVIVGSQAALFTRTESYFENSIFSDEEAWTALDAQTRMDVSQRLNRGVVWAAVSETLSQARNVRFRPGRVKSASIHPAEAGAPAELMVEISDAKNVSSEAACLVIDAAGFDAWWFAKLLPESIKKRTLAAGTKTKEQRRKDLVETMDADLSLDIGASGFHAPMLSLAQGPGFSSLMVLGAMSERILRSYIDPLI